MLANVCSHFVLCKNIHCYRKQFVVLGVLCRTQRVSVDTRQLNVWKPLLKVKAEN